MKNLLVLSLSLLLMVSCIPRKNLVYVQPPEEELKDRNDYVNIKTARTIDAKDEIYIKVLSTDEEVATILSRESKDRFNFNLQLISYIVDERGYIDFPFVGKIQLQGLTLAEAETKILEELEAYLSNVSLIIKFVNNRITLLGEFNRPGEYFFNYEKMSVFTAIGQAGGIAPYGDKKNIILIRDEDNRITYHYLDLTDKKIVESEYYYLLPNDVLIVNPVNAKFWSMTSFNWGTFLTLVTTALAILYYVDRQ
jgi:polysaccharide export outer membrane protein